MVALLATAHLPELTQRLFAIPVSVALVGLGYSLWREQRSAAARPLPRFTAFPLPLVVHIVSALGYAILGAFQFSTALRQRRPGWHRAAGRVLLLLGLAVALSARWLTLFSPRRPGAGLLAYLFRIVFSSGLAASLVLGFAAIRHPPSAVATSPATGPG